MTATPPPMPLNSAAIQALLRQMFDAAIASAQPALCLPPHLPAPPATGRLIVLAAGCGRKGDPLAPLPSAPAAVADASVRRIDDRVEVRVTIPAENAAGTTPSILVEVFVLRT